MLMRIGLNTFLAADIPGRNLDSLLCRICVLWDPAAGGMGHILVSGSCSGMVVEFWDDGHGLG